MTDPVTRLKERKLVQWALAYVAAAFALVQVLDVVTQRFGWPELFEKLLILALVVGFFVVLVLAWYHGECGAQRTSGVEILIIALLLVIGGGLIGWFHHLSMGVHESNADTAVRGTSNRDEVQRAAGAVPAIEPVAVSSIPTKSVAVLPFTNESGKVDEQFFSDGLSDDLINALSQFDGLKVISRNSAFQFRDSKDSADTIGRKLGVKHLLEGSVQRAENMVRITATLVNASDGSIVWSGRYDKPYRDLFALQDAITLAVADALKAKLLTTPGAVVQNDRPPSGNLEAYAAYQRGMAYAALGTEAGGRQATAAFNEAIRLDPEYAAAYAQSSRIWSDLAKHFFKGDAEINAASAGARNASASALRLDSDSSLAHLAHADLLLFLDKDWHAAELEYRRALQLSPNDPEAKFGFALVLASLGQNRHAADFSRQALVANPRNGSWYHAFGVQLAALGQLGAARGAITTAIALQPSAPRYHRQLAIVEILRGNATAAMSAAQQETETDWRDEAVFLTLQIGRDRAAADDALKSMIKQYAGIDPYQIAQIHALRRQPDRMFQWLDRAWDARDAGTGNLLSDPIILRYRDDPRFLAFCIKAGLPTITDAVAMR